MNKCKINAIALGLAMGLIWGPCVFLMGLIATFYSYGKPFVAALGTIYIGYAPSILGGLIGGIFGFFDAFIGGVILAWLYNLISKYCCKVSD